MAPSTSPHNRYRRNYITNAICQIEFPELNGFNDPKAVRSLYEQFRDAYPINRSVKEEQINVEKSNEHNVSFSTVTKYGSNISNADDTRIIGIRANSLILEFKKYENFDIFFSEIRDVFDKFQKHFNINQVDRVGLRYINQIVIGEGDPLNWDGYVNDNLRGVTEHFITREDRLSRSMHVLIISDESYTLKYQFGNFNSEFPNPIARKEYVFDLDCYINDKLTYPEIFSKIQMFNDVIYQWFERSIGDKLRQDMEVIDDE